MEKTTPQKCLDWVMLPDRLFCDLPADAREAFDVIKLVMQYPGGTALFREGRRADNIFIVSAGRVKLSVCSESGKRLTLRIAGPGEVLGLSASLSSGPYELTAETVDAAEIAVVKRKDLLRFLRDYPEPRLRVVHLLSQDLHIAYDRMRSIGLCRHRRPPVARPN